MIVIHVKNFLDFKFTAHFICKEDLLVTNIEILVHKDNSERNKGRRSHIWLHRQRLGTKESRV